MEKNLKLKIRPLLNIIFYFLMLVFIMHLGYELFRFLDLHEQLKYETRILERLDIIDKLDTNIFQNIKNYFKKPYN